MAQNRYGAPPVSRHTMPPGRRAFGSAADPVVRSVTQGTHADGQARDGASQPHGKFATAEEVYRHERGAHRLENVPNNPHVDSKSTKRYGRNDTTGEQPAGLETRELPGTIIGHDVNPPAVHAAEHLDPYFGRPTFPNTGRSTGGLHRPGEGTYSRQNPHPGTRK
jgi:hypothetical protein